MKKATKAPPRKTGRSRGRLQILLGAHTPGVALAKALRWTPQEVIEEVKRSQIKGRGGAGFPTGLEWEFAAKAGEKWDEVAQQQGNEKYIICNADEGEPGTFKDRVLLSEHPEKMFEGMAIAGYAIGSRKGFVYLRGEYYFLKERLEQTLADLRAKKLMGSRILGSRFDFDVEIRVGAGAYVCGEEFALIESMNGNRGEPRNKPPFPAERGYLDKPTVVNNVETLSYIPTIIEKGAAWFTRYGIEGSTGTKLFSVSGDVERPGVYEFELGIILRELLREVGGENAKAVQIGGASGINVAQKDFDKPISYQALPPSGSIIVFGQGRDMLTVLKNFMEFFCEESCGQCTPCREGSYQLLKGLHMIEEGKASMRYLRELELLCEVMRDSSKCGLGQTAPNPFQTIIRNFKDEIFYR